jgi:hypothetical protein
MHISEATFLGISEAAFIHVSETAFMYTSETAFINQKVGTRFSFFFARLSKQRPTFFWRASTVLLASQYVYL